MKKQNVNGRQKLEAEINNQPIIKLERKRPGSEQSIQTQKSHSHSRKTLLSGNQQQRQNINIRQQFPQQNIIRSNRNSQHSSMAQLNLQQNQQSLNQIAPIQKHAKPPLNIDKKKIIFERYEQIGSSGRPRKAGDVQTRNNIQYPISSAGQKAKQFNWIDVKELPQQETPLNKRRLVSREKLKAIPVSYQSHQEQQQNIQCSEQNELDQLFAKSTQNKQPLCYNDFSRTSKKNDLPKAFASFQAKIQQTLQEVIQNPVVQNMNEIPEQEDDGTSSIEQSTLYKFQR